jgi:hypothetical protein
MLMRFSVFSIFPTFAALAAVPVSAAHTLFARGDWAAIDFGARCEARSRMLQPPAQVKPPPFAGFLFDPAGPAHGQFYVRLSRPTKPGSAVMLSVDNLPFLLTGQGESAWSRSPAQSQAIMAAVRGGGTMRLEFRDIGGRRYSDYYDLTGAATAIDAAAAACAGKVR